MLQLLSDDNVVVCTRGARSVGKRSLRHKVASRSALFFGLHKDPFRLATRSAHFNWLFFGKVTGLKSRYEVVCLLAS